MLETSELKSRIEARKHDLLSKFNDLKADTAHEASKARDAIKAKLDELETSLKEGWDNISDAARTKLHAWLEPKDEQSK